MSNGKKEILEFIHRRFAEDNNWSSGNCYYFAVILKDRFKLGKIVYDVIGGHFMYQEDGVNYDWTGIVEDSDARLIDWDTFDKYDELQRARIIRDCIN